MLRCRSIALPCSIIGIKKGTFIPKKHNVFLDHKHVLHAITAEAPKATTECGHHLVGDEMRQ
uniref:Uncharacterized protein n=1 Tax=Anopheles atroparvus TaxID=41427 RepID=A0AAG5D034_ANOAO